MDELFGLPAHPLMVHFPVVAIPVLAILGVVMAINADFRDRYGRAVIVLGLVTTVATFMAAGSGDALSEELNYGDDEIGTHRSLGEALRLFVLGLTLSLIGLVTLGRRRESIRNDPGGIAASLIVVALAVLSIVWTVRTGHEGAKSTWSFLDSSAETVESADDAAPDADTPTTDTTTTDTPTTEAPTTDAEPDTTVDPAQSGMVDDGAIPVDADGGDGSSAPVDAQALYEANCARCHGADGNATRGPDLVAIATTEPDTSVAIEQIINGGNGMPAFGSRLNPQEIEAIVDYIYENF